MKVKSAILPIFLTMVLSALSALSATAAAPKYEAHPKSEAPTTTFIDIGAALTGVADAATAWGDYDNDGDLDILLTGRFSGGFNATSLIYRNDGSGVFTNINAGLTGVSYGAAAWGDYDRDGDLDIFLSGLDSSLLAVTKLYRNDGGGLFVDLGNAGLSMFVDSVDWGDYDNDGDLDILSTGLASSVYNNNGGFFTDINAGLVLVSPGEAAWGDYDNDGDLDIIVTGDAGAQVAPTTRIYRNDGGNLFTDMGNAGIANVSFSSVDWGDYDNDGDLDIVLTGCIVYFFTCTSAARVYQNNGGLFTDLAAGLMGMSTGSSKWGDYDNDGDLDILLTGVDSAFFAVAKVYNNNGGLFTDIGAGLTGVSEGAAVWGDYDNDSDLDILLAGTGQNFQGVSRVYANTLTPVNAPPSAPSGLSVALGGNGDSATLSWQAATDDHTPAAGLSYNLRVGTSPGASDVVGPMADTATGYRRVAELGGVDQNLSWTLNGLTTYQTYYWSVQAIDGAFAGSPFAREGVFRARLAVKVAQIEPLYEVRGNYYRIGTTVDIESLSGSPVAAGVAVILRIDQPDGSTFNADLRTNSSGRATVRFYSAYTGLYTFTVQKVSCSYCLYSPAYNNETSDSIMVP